MVNAFSALVRKEDGDPSSEEENDDTNCPSKPKETTGHPVYMFFLCVLWYAVSSGSNIVGKLLLAEFRFPCSIAMFHLVSLSIFVAPFVCKRHSSSSSSSGDHNELSSFSARGYLIFIVPLAAGKFLSSYLSLISIANIPVSFSSTGELSDSACLSV